MRLSLIIPILAIFFFNHCAGFITQTWKTPKTIGTAQKVRVLLGKADTSELKFTTNGVFQVYDVNDLLIKKSIDILQINPGSLKAKIRIKPENGNFLYQNVRYRGEVLIDPSSDGLYIINSVELEEYLQSVVPSEVPSTWPEEALKAQAVCARTYVIREMLNKASQPFDVSKTTSSQVYSGMDKENPRTTKAVEETKGTILVYDGEPIEAFFHSNAGGYTEKPENVWTKPLPYLLHVDSSYDADAPNYSWEDRILSKDIDRLLSSLDLGSIDNIQVIKRNFSQRVELLEVKGEKGTVNIKGKDFRKLIGETKLKSLKFGIKKEVNVFYLKGLGSGHGVGMSQWGAYGMAKDKKLYSSILLHYYPGTDLAKMIP
jgi:stage II sporulation protein D